MIYNDAEELVETLCIIGLQLPIQPREVLSRINGIDGITAIAKKVCAQRGFTEEEMTALCDTLGKGGFEGLKGWRDAVIHARIFDAATSIGKQKIRKGAVADVLSVAEPALAGAV